MILKGGSDAIHSNTAIVASLRKTLKEEQVPEDALLLIEDTSRETTAQFMKMNRYVDVLIPRGGAGLIRTVVENSTILSLRREPETVISTWMRQPIFRRWLPPHLHDHVRRS